MYNCDIESNKEQMQQYISNQKKASAERLKQVASKLKLKRQNKSKE
jgi:hypothetical protein